MGGSGWHRGPGAGARPDPRLYRSLLAGTLPKVITDTRCNQHMIDVPVVEKLNIGNAGSSARNRTDPPERRVESARDDDIPAFRGACHTGEAMRQLWAFWSPCWWRW
ncbi:hypothetical protein E7Y31_16320 [Candidatus Frankia alpina]|uniref:Uncharacterized protein n=1 Tax=Candidatus Frankia alpina TaxID=2699483 RepID=A0A4V3Z6F3_9ACTN|nr:hypothetical protein E7Y31_16320 [Candidatus Frankia alpina]